jgi:putative transposase
MPKKRHKAEEIVAKLRQVDILVSQGQNVADAIRLKDLETENVRLRRAVSDLTLDKLILQEAARGNF